jgi:hypothetical protein
MLIAEIHGKRFPESEGQEDWLTSAVFGHLRLIPPAVFWPGLFERALTIETPPISLSSELSRVGVEVNAYTNLETVFWKDCGNFGEPDLLLRFTADAVEPLVLLIEVKLNSTKSGVGDDDQLAKYLALLDDGSMLPDWKCGEDHRYLIYLTQTFAKLELEASVLASGRPNAARRMFGLEWRDVLEVSSSEAHGGFLLLEVAKFLKGRGFEAFRGMRQPALPGIAFSGGFYGSDYFTHDNDFIRSQEELRGVFYGG